MKKEFEIWPQRVNMGLNYGRLNSPCINLGIKFRDKYYFDSFIEMKKEEKYRMAINLGYQFNKITQINTQGQVGFSLLLLPNKLYTDKLTKIGLNAKLLQPISRKFGVFVSGNAALPNDKINNNQLLMLNLGIEIYFKKLPFLFY